MSRARIGQRPNRVIYNAPPVVVGQQYDDTRMSASGMVRNGGGSLYHGFTPVDGAGDVVLYNSWQGVSGTPIQSIPNAIPGTFYPVAGAPLEVIGLVCVQGSRNVDYRVD